MLKCTYKRACSSAADTDMWRRLFVRGTCSVCLRGHGLSTSAIRVRFYRLAVNKDEGDTATIVTDFRKMCCALQSGYYPLHLAAMVGNADIVSVLLEHIYVSAPIKAAGTSMAGHLVNLRQTDFNGVSALQLAVNCGHTHIVELFVNLQAEHQQQQRRLKASIAEDDDEQLKLLITAKDADTIDLIGLHAHDADGFTVLHRAVHNEHIKMVKLLCKSGADVNIKTLSDGTVVSQRSGTNTSSQREQVAENENKTSLQMCISRLGILTGSEKQASDLQSGVQARITALTRISNILKTFSDHAEATSLRLHSQSLDTASTSVDEDANVLISIQVDTAPNQLTHTKTAVFEFGAVYDDSDICAPNHVMPTSPSTQPAGPPKRRSSVTERIAMFNSSKLQALSNLPAQETKVINDEQNSQAVGSRQTVESTPTLEQRRKSIAQSTTPPSNVLVRGGRGNRQSLVQLRGASQGGAEIAPNSTSTVNQLNQLAGTPLAEVPMSPVTYAQPLVQTPGPLRKMPSRRAPSISIPAPSETADTNTGATPTPTTVVLGHTPALSSVNSAYTAVSGADSETNSLIQPTVESPTRKSPAFSPSLLRKMPSRRASFKEPPPVPPASVAPSPSASRLTSASDMFNSQVRVEKALLPSPTAPDQTISLLEAPAELPTRQSQAFSPSLLRKMPSRRASFKDPPPVPPPSAAASPPVSQLASTGTELIPQVPLDETLLPSPAAPLVDAQLPDMPVVPSRKLPPKRVPLAINLSNPVSPVRSLASKQTNVPANETQMDPATASGAGVITRKLATRTAPRAQQGTSATIANSAAGLPAHAQEGTMASDPVVPLTANPLTGTRRTSLRPGSAVRSNVNVDGQAGVSTNCPPPIVRRPAPRSAALQAPSIESELGEVGPAIAVNSVVCERPVEKSTEIIALSADGDSLSISKTAVPQSRPRLLHPKLSAQFDDLDDAPKLNISPMSPLAARKRLMFSPDKLSQNAKRLGEQLQSSDVCLDEAGVNNFSKINNYFSSALEVSD
jgi:hypothetical protein